MAEEKRYAILSALTIERCAEACGIEDLHPDIIHALAEDASYRMREVANTSAQFMKQGRRSKLTARDVSRALKLHNIPPTLGEDHASSPEYGCIEDDFYYLKDEQIDVLANSGKVEDMTEAVAPTLKSDWLLFGGLPQKDGQIESLPEVSNVLSEYFTYVVTCILGDDKELRIEALNDLSRNSKIASLIPHFVNFISNMNAVSHDLEQLSNLLQTASALARNPYLNFIGYLKPLVSAVLYCVLEPLAVSISPINDHWLLRDYGAWLLGNIISRHGHSNGDIIDYITESIKNILSDSTRPLCSHYGAIAALNALGTAYIRTLLLPDFVNYYQTSIRIVEEVTDCNNVHLKEDAHKVVGAVLHALEKLVKEKPDADLMNYYEIFSIFGDSIACRLPLHSRTALGSQTVTENNAQIYYGPVIKKSLELRRRRISSSVKEVFPASRFCKRKINIVIGGRGLPNKTKSKQAYKTTVFVSLCNNTLHTGKSKSLLKKISRPKYYDYSTLYL